MKIKRSHKYTDPNKVRQSEKKRVIQIAIGIIKNECFSLELPNWRALYRELDEIYYTGREHERQRTIEDYE